MEPTPTTIRISVAPFVTYAALYIAMEEGFFTDENLAIEVVQIARSSNAIPALAGGELEAMGSNVSAALLNAIARDADIRIVASTVQEVPESCSIGALVYRHGILPDGQDLEMNLSGDVLRELRYYVSTAAMSTYQMDLWLQHYGLSLDDVTLVDLPNSPASLDLLEQGTLDVASLSEPWVARVRALGIGNVLASRNEILPDAQHSVIVFGPSILEDDPAAGERFMVAYLRGVRQLAEGRTSRNLEILSKHLELELDLLEAICWPYIPTDGKVLTDSLTDFSIWATERDLMDRPLTSEEFWESRFVDYANQELGAP
jgi:NitT/TauT family transport system substrate-binding protein